MAVVVIAGLPLAALAISRIDWPSQPRIAPSVSECARRWNADAGAREHTAELFGKRYAQVTLLRDGGDCVMALSDDGVVSVYRLRATWERDASVGLERRIEQGSDYHVSRRRGDIAFGQAQGR